MKSNQNYFYKEMPDSNFGVDIILRSDLPYGAELHRHWHEHLQLFFSSLATPNWSVKIILLI
jgi:hypothetical protein